MFMVIKGWYSLTSLSAAEVSPEDGVNSSGRCSQITRPKVLLWCIMVPHALLYPFKKKINNCRYPIILWIRTWLLCTGHMHYWFCRIWWNQSQYLWKDLSKKPLVSFLHLIWAKLDILTQYCDNGGALLVNVREISSGLVISSASLLFLPRNFWGNTDRLCLPLITNGMDGSYMRLS